MAQKRRVAQTDDSEAAAGDDIEGRLLGRKRDETFRRTMLYIKVYFTNNTYYICAISGILIRIETKPLNSHLVA